MHRLLACLAVAASAIAVVPETGEAQYFGRNKVQYDRFDFQVLPTDHYDIHFYPEAATPVGDAARMAERWYERTARILQHDIRGRRPLVLYADHPDFQQTNILQGRIGEGTGGVTEGIRDRIILPLGASYSATNHVLGHEIIHSFQFDIAQSRRGPGLQGLMRLPLWFVEGQAEYLSLGPESSLTGMWIRDALLNDEFPTLGDMSDDQQRYFPYRFGHAFWAYVGGMYGDDMMAPLLRAATQGGGYEGGVERVLGVSADTLSEQWERAAREHYGPRMEGRTAPGEVGALLLSPATGAGRINVSPSISPDGRWVTFLSERDLFTIELFLADAQTGEIVRSLTSTTRDAHFDALRFIDSSGGWSPDSERIAISVFAEGRNRIEIYDVRGRRQDRVRVPEWLGEVRNPTFSPDGGSILFSGQSGGVSNLFTVEIATGEVEQLTDDRHAAFQPAFSPDGSTVAFVTDMGPRTDFDRLTFGKMAIGVLDMESRNVRRLAPLGEEAEHWNPQFTPDGLGLYFLADPDGFRDIFRVDVDGSSLVRVTNVVTAVSGITEAAPALSVARETGAVVFSVFDRSEYHVFGLDAVEAGGDPVVADDVAARGGQRLAGAPPVEQPGRVQALIEDPGVGMPAPDRYNVDDADVVRAGLGLDWIGQPTVGAGVDRWGTFFVGSVAASFSDILGDRNLFTGVQAQGELKDVGGQVFYSEVGRRWNWGLGAAHIPVRQFFLGPRTQEPDGTRTVSQILSRTYYSQLQGQYQYPFSQVRRMEFGAGYSRIGFDLTEEQYIFNSLGQLVAHQRVSLEEEVPDALHLAEVSAAFVGDNSYFGFTGPVRGWRYRFEVGQTIGSLDFARVTADYRRYFAPHRNLTLGFRGMHVGRYGAGLEESPIREMYLGWETLVRGYSPGSSLRQLCPNADCPEFQRLMGHRLGVVNVEARIPVLGTDDFGLLPSPFLPLDLILFADGGVAWNKGDSPELRWDRDSNDRIPVFSTGVALRTNLLGALVLEFYYAQPWQWPERGSHWGVSFAPGW